MMGYLVAMEKYVTLFLSMHFAFAFAFARYNFEINRYNIDEFRNMQASYVLFDVTSRKNG